MEKSADYHIIRVDSRFAPCQWKMSLQSNAVFHCLGANLESILYYVRPGMKIKFYRQGILYFQPQHKRLFVVTFFMEPPTMLLVPICRDMQLWWDKPPIPSPRKRMPSETCFDDVGRICARMTWTQMYLTLQTKNVFHSKAVIILFF